MAFYGGAQPIKIIGGPTSFYEEYTLTNLYVERVFGGTVGTVTISNDSTTKSVQVSYDGATLEAELSARESLTLNVQNRSSIYTKADTDGDAVRIWGW